MSSHLHIQRPGDSNVQLPLPLIRSSYQHLVTARDEADRSAKELAELKASRVQLIPPSAWVKREAKYKMDQEKYEHTVSMLNQRIERLEAELQILREGANLKPLEEKIKVGSCSSCAVFTCSSCSTQPVVARAFVHHVLIAPLLTSTVNDMLQSRYWQAH